MNRVERLLAAAGIGEGKAALLHNPSNIFYLSGYTGEGLLLLADGLNAIITDFRYVEQAESQAPGFSVHSVKAGVSHAQVAAKLLAGIAANGLLIEENIVTIREMRALEAAMPGVSMKAMDFAPEKLRRIKDTDELNRIERACDISCQAFDYICGQIKAGMTEKEIQLALDYKMLQLGAQGLAFNTIVAAGSHGSLPHAIPSCRKVENGDMVTLDFGAKVEGYCADMTRTVAVGQPSEQMRSLYDIVLRAQEAAQAAQAPGKKCSDIDAAARDIIGAAGYGDFFGHGLGHGVGIDIHEEPRYNTVCGDLTETGMVITVEPGIYIPGVGGVRIENTCVITENGSRTLVSASKELRIL